MVAGALGALATLEREAVLVMVFFVGIVRYCLRIIWLERMNERRRACRSQPIA